MDDSFQNEISVLPVTALAFLQLDCLYLLAGEGNYLSIFEYESKRLLLTSQVFDSQAVHGIIGQTLPQRGANLALVLIWGGRSVCVLGIKSIVDCDGKFAIKVTRYVQEFQASDWILDGCHEPFVPGLMRPEKASSRFLLVTAHNELLIQDIEFDLNGGIGAAHSPTRVAAGPKSILYSAHLIWQWDGRALVAAGTVFGEVLLWSCLTGSAADGPSIADSHDTFIGHEGSVFGVRISENMGKRVLASCSDDRTIRVWRISETKFKSEFEEPDRLDMEERRVGSLRKSDATYECGCLATVMGHASRIWGIRFLSFDRMVSYGEDSTAQIWSLKPSPEVNASKTKSSTFEITHEATHSYHAGKNLWAVAIHSLPSDECFIASGGADGRIVTYKPSLSHANGGDDACSSRCSIQHASMMVESVTKKQSNGQGDPIETLRRQTFNGLEGEWMLSRTINSVLKTYPSAVLEGTATFLKRPSTDEAFAAEYLYSESGDFVSEAGLKMQATRQYVYRYSAIEDAITVWFVKVDDGSKVDYYFHELVFQGEDAGDNELSRDDDTKDLTATGHHLCVEDEYNPDYVFRIKGSQLEQWSVKFLVQGPKKDYTTTSTYTRDEIHNILTPKISIQDKDSTCGPSNGAGVVDGHPIWNSTLDSFKIYTWISENTFLTTTHLGNLMLGTVGAKPATEMHSTVLWEPIIQQPLPRSSCLATSVPSLGLAFLTGMDGTVFLYEHSGRTVDIVHRLPRKAGFLKAQGLSVRWAKSLPASSEATMVGLFATCLGSPQATALILYSDQPSSSISVQSDFQLNLPPDFVATRSCFLDRRHHIILGSRSGDLAVYILLQNPHTSSQNIKPQIFRHIHNEEAIIVIETISSTSADTNKINILTAGRDGRYRIHSLSFNNTPSIAHLITLQTIHTGTPPFGPNIEGACISAETLYLWGFRSKEFVVWNETQKIETMTVDCGGAHRSWAYSHNQDGKGGGRLVYTKASVCHVHSQIEASNRVFQNGGHGREIKAMALSPPIKNIAKEETSLLATGAEDTSIRLFSLGQNLTTKTKPLTTIANHTTGLQALHFSPNGHYLFSAAGCEEFSIWRLRSAPLVAVGVVCEAKCPVVSEEADLRIMDFAALPIHNSSTAVNDRDDKDDGDETEPDYLLSMAYSDSSIRIFRYQTQSHSFILLFSGSYTTYCLTQITHLHTGTTLHLCTASTDGHLAFWPIPLSSQVPIGIKKRQYVISNPHDLPPAQRINIECIQRIRIHQNSIKSLITTPLSPNEHLITTAGDDGAIAFTRLRHTPTHAPIRSTLLIPKAHASAVTAIADLGALDADQNGAVVKSRFASVSDDQRLKTWVVSVNMEREGVDGVRVEKEGDVVTQVADGSSLVAGEVEAGKRLFVGGIGMEGWRMGGGGERNGGLEAGNV